MAQDLGKSLPDPHFHQELIPILKTLLPYPKLRYKGWASFTNILGSYTKSSFFKPNKHSHASYKSQAQRFSDLRPFNASSEELNYREAPVSHYLK